MGRGTGRLSRRAMKMMSRYLTISLILRLRVVLCSSRSVGLMLSRNSGDNRTWRRRFARVRLIWLVVRVLVLRGRNTLDRKLHEMV